MRPVMLEIARRGSIAILLCHSHVEAYAHPSRIDIFETRRLLSLCRSIGVELVDHVILAQQDIFSFRQSGLL
jgi:DNA repair protein RadC